MNYFSLGEIVTDLAPEAEKKNLRNSEGAFLRLGNGNHLDGCDRYGTAGQKESRCLFP